MGCKGACQFPNYKGDGNCDDENNNCGCQYDGGDCCTKTVKGGKVQTKYCKSCKCLDPANGGGAPCDGTCKFPNYKGMETVTTKITTVAASLTAEIAVSLPSRTENFRANT